MAAAPVSLDDDDGTWDMTESMWEPAFWFVLRVMSYNYPASPDYPKVPPSARAKQAFARLLELFCELLPHKAAQARLAQLLVELEFSVARDMQSRHTFSWFVYRLFCAYYGLPALLHEYHQDREGFECFRARCAHPNDEVVPAPRTAAPEQGCVKPKGYVKSQTLMHIRLRREQTKADPNIALLACSRPEIRVHKGCFEQRQEEQTKMAGDSNASSAAAPPAPAHDVKPDSQQRRQRRRRRRKPWCDQDYESNDGFNTLIWGPALWILLHLIAAWYPVAPSAALQARATEFVQLLATVLPCGTCRKNLPKNLSQVGWVMNDPEKATSPHHHQPSAWVASKHAFSTLVHRLHNEVAQRTNTGKPRVGFSKLMRTLRCFRVAAGGTREQQAEMVLVVVPIANNTKQLASLTFGPGVRARCAGVS